jgi:hypothetical protein
MIKYIVRSRDLIGIYNEIKAKRLIPDAYFQRNLVWRDIHKQDFIKTILLGYPFPQIFISKGTVDVENMVTTSCIVDGQQRTNAIVDFIDNKFAVDGRLFKELSGPEKETFLKYDVAVIELDVDNNNPAVKEIFQRINRTANSLTAIEKMASQYAPSEFMFVARLFVDDIDLENSEDFQIDPNIPAQLIEWGKKHDVSDVQKVLLNDNVFSDREIIRKVPLQYALNLMATILSGYFHRNEGSKECLDNYAEEFPAKDLVTSVMKQTASKILELNLSAKSIWLKKATFFTLYAEIAECVRAEKQLDVQALREKLIQFEGNIPEDFELAAREAVNNKQERITRGKYLKEIVASISTGG